jgi:hypothetical protein
MEKLFQTVTTLRMVRELRAVENLNFHRFPTAIPVELVIFPVSKRIQASDDVVLHLHVTKFRKVIFQEEMFDCLPKQLTILVRSSRPRASMIATPSSALFLLALRCFIP